MIAILFSRPGGPGRPRGGGGQKVVKPVKTPPPPDDGGGTGFRLPCFSIVAAVAVPALTLLAACTALAEGAIR